MTVTESPTPPPGLPPLTPWRLVDLTVRGLVSDRRERRELRRTLLPPAAALQAGPLAPRTSGLVGVHRAPRPGDATLWFPLVAWWW